MIANVKSRIGSNHVTYHLARNRTLRPYPRA
jgi:hypothetical protein